MFRRQWKWFGKLISNEGFSLAHGNKATTYIDHRGSFEFAYEDGFVFLPPHQVRGKPVSLAEAEINSMVEHVLSGIRFEGHIAEVFQKHNAVPEPKRGTRDTS